MPERPDHPDQVVIVGGGLAGARSAQELRKQGFKGKVTLLAAERHFPYDRPPLSKGLLRSAIDDVTLDVTWLGPTVAPRRASRDPGGARGGL